MAEDLIIEAEQLESIAVFATGYYAGLCVSGPIDSIIRHTDRGTEFKNKYTESAGVGVFTTIANEGMDELSDKYLSGDLPGLGKEEYPEYWLGAATGYATFRSLEDLVFKYLDSDIRQDSHEI